MKFANVRELKNETHVEDLINTECFI